MALCVQLDSSKSELTPSPFLTFISKPLLGNGPFCWRQPWGTEWWKSTEGNWLKQSRDCLTGQSCLAGSGWSRQLRKSFHWDHVSHLLKMKLGWSRKRLRFTWRIFSSSFPGKIDTKQNMDFFKNRVGIPAFYTLPFPGDFSAKICLIKSYVDSKIVRNDPP